MLKVESTGKTLDEAIENGLAELKVSKENVDIKIIEKGGFFKKAKVILTVDEDVEQKLKQRDTKIAEEEILINNIEEVQSERPFNVEKMEDNEKTEEVKKLDTIVDNQEDLSVVASGVINFIKQYCALQSIDFNYLIQENQDDINVDIRGEGTEKLIGYRGEGINSLQYLCNIIASKINKNCPRVYINVGNYKQEREQSLIKLARRLASKVAKTKLSMKLEPMTAYERKIIHNALQNDSFVKTYSVGEEPKRCLVIDLK